MADESKQVTEPTGAIDPKPDAESRPPSEPLADALPPEVRATLDALEEHKGLDIVVMDMRRVSGFTDFMVVCTGRSEPHVRALADAVSEELAGRSIKPGHVEGKSGGQWVLLDFLQVVVHVFTPERRSFYQLEKLWRDAPLLEWSVPASNPEGSAPGDAGERDPDPETPVVADEETGTED